MTYEHLKSSLEMKELENKKLKKALSDIIDLYVANIGTKHEFISCITPKSSIEMTYFERYNSPVWNVFDNARILLGGKYTIWKEEDDEA